ncbi:MAG: NAD+ synthase [Phycisphaerales bacterium]
MRMAMVQCNTTVGSLTANAKLLRDRASEAADAGARLIVGPELAISGYPPRDLLVQEGFVDACVREMESMARAWSSDAALLVGTPWPVGDRGVANGLAVVRSGAIETVYTKRLLPTYDVFDEDRYFVRGDEACVIDVDGVRVGLAVCEDLWRGGDIVDASDGVQRYAGRRDPSNELIHAGAQLIAVASASPFTHEKLAGQRTIVQATARKLGVPVVACNLVGANDDLVFPGGSVACGSDGRALAFGGLFEEGVVVVESDGATADDDPLARFTREELIFRALVMGVRDYCVKTGFERCVLGVSGGIDSAVVAAIASAAVGPEHVIALAMPSRHSSDHSVEDAQDLCARLGVAYHAAPIAPMHDVAEASMTPLFADLGIADGPSVAEENIQSRLRGLTVMAVANKAGALALATGNKSELAVGYCTLYGDMNGALAVIGDVLKQDVYALARWMNAHHERAGFGRAPIPERTIEKRPSAELAPGQFDTDSLPEYDVLDEILHRYVEQRQHPDVIVRETGFEDAVVRRITRMTDLNEHKRYQMALGLKVSSIAFGRGRRRPLVSGRW